MSSTAVDLNTLIKLNDVAPMHITTLLNIIRRYTSNHNLSHK